jgi:hypothetical protein
MTAGRNEPYPCGSGRKFKRCCLGAGEAAPRAFTPADRERALQALERFATRPELEADREALTASW